MEDLRPEDFDDIDESTVEYHDARHVTGDTVTTQLVVPLTRDQARALDAIADLDGKTIFEAARDAVDAYAAARLHDPAPRRRAG
ncbi:MAG TPA: hypothetical protein VFU94_14675 [Conexibacter sp.]|nr:hypothetical protein [Conexibacter sp.]